MTCRASAGANPAPSSHGTPLRALRLDIEAPSPVCEHPCADPLVRRISTLKARRIRALATKVPKTASPRVTINTTPLDSLWIQPNPLSRALRKIEQVMA
jgi:hypothetical protein